MLHRIEAGVLDIAYEAHGDSAGWPVVLLHGFPYDVRCYDAVAPLLAAAGAWVIVPYLRGYGPTRFLDEATPRSGQQASLGADLLALLDALAIPKAIVAGYDWGGRAACIVSALTPERVTGLVTQNGYNIQNIAKSGEPAAPENELRHWYQYYFHGERGRAGLTKNRYELCRLLWRLWSPTWAFDEATYARSAVSFENPDFVDVVIQSYRHRYRLAAGDPAVEDWEQRLVAQPAITVPAILLDGTADGVASVGRSALHVKQFSGRHEHRIIPDGGHNLPQEKPDAFADAILTVHGWAA